MVVVYSKNQCQPCRLTKMALERRGVEFIEKRVDEDPRALEEIKNLGYLQVPVVVAADGSHWSGLNPEKINSLG